VLSFILRLLQEPAYLYLVADPRRSLSKYQPTIDRSPFPDRKSPVIDIVIQKSTTVSAEAITKASVIAGFGPIIDGQASTNNNITYSLTAEELKTYTMLQVSDAWKTVNEGNDAEMMDFVKGKKGKAYFMVSIKTAI
jgi:hypothetical protein